jgi:TRAP transporter TAXI family solute receptor
MLGYTRSHLFAALAVVAALIAAIWIALGFVFPSPPTKVDIASSFPGGHFQALARRYKSILARSGVTLDVLTTDGSVENLKLLNDPSWKVPIGLMQGGVADAETAPDLLSLGRIDYQVFWLFSSTKENLSDLAQLKGKRIALAPLGSGARLVCERILNKAGVTSDNSTLLYLMPEQAFSALKNKTIDALFVNFSPESPILDSLLRDSDFQVMSFKDAEALTRVFPYLVRMVLPRGVIDYESKIPATDVVLIGTTNVVLVRKDLHPAIIDLLAQAMTAVHSAPGLFQHLNEFPNLADPEYSIADEAREFFKNGPSFLNRYLPFWVTNYVKRAAAVLLTAIAIFPLLSYGPRIYRWFVEYRLLKLYKRLRSIERHLKDNIAMKDVEELKAQVESLDREIVALGVPMRHSDIYFTMKSHLNLVRNRLDMRSIQLQR